MKRVERRQYDMLVRVRDFGGGYGHLFPESSVARANFAAVAAAVTELDAHEVAHRAASVAARAHRKVLAREALRARLLAISQTARVLAADAPGLERQFQLSNPASDHTLLTTARSFGRDAEPFASEFIARGMPATFLADVQALVDSLERAQRDRGLGYEARRAARARTRAALAAGRAAVRSLNAIVVNHLRDDTVTRTVWEQIRRVVYPARDVGTSVTTEPAPAPAAAVTDAPTGIKAA